MKYFEINSPYYGLMKAENAEEAIQVYVEYVADEEPGSPLIEEIKEVDRDYALIIYALGTDESGNGEPVKEIIESFNEEKSDILAIDSSLF